MCLFHFEESKKKHSAKNKTRQRRAYRVRLVSSHKHNVRQSASPSNYSDQLQPVQVVLVKEATFPREEKKREGLTN
jgi:hypothetical protein